MSNIESIVLQPHRLRIQQIREMFSALYKEGVMSIVQASDMLYKEFGEHSPTRATLINWTTPHSKIRISILNLDMVKEGAMYYQLVFYPEIRFLTQHYYKKSIGRPKLPRNGRPVKPQRRVGRPKKVTI